MSVSECCLTVNLKGEETDMHGTVQFPISFYEENISAVPVPLHWHEDFEILWVTSGSVNVFINTSRHTLKKGSGIFVNAGVLHSVSAGRAGSCMIRSFVFHPRLIGSIDSIYRQKYLEPIIQNKKLPFVFLRPASVWQNRVLTLSASVWDRLYAEQRGYEIYVRNELSEIILHLLQNQARCETRTNPGNIRNADRIKDMLQYIHTHYSEEISITDLAGTSIISASEVLRCFHSTIHVTPVRYIRQFRIERAAVLLTDTDLSSAEIAFQCGFQSSSYFTKTFREIKGCTPLDYRRINGASS